MCDPGGQFAIGENWHQRLYQCKDDWIYVGASPEQANSLMESVIDNKDASKGALQAAFLKQPSSIWLKKLDAVPQRMLGSTFS